MLFGSVMIDDILNPINFRYERKSLIAGINRYEIESIIKTHPAIFMETYPKRYVNNIYFDTNSMSHYFDNIDGIGKRLKVRIRWYGDLFGFINKNALELKIKKNLLGGKKSYPLNSFYFDNNYSFKLQQEIFIKSGLPDGLIEYLKSLHFALLNRYCRKYFVSADHKFRITIDFGMEYYKLNPANNLFNEKVVDYENTILELKYSDKDDNLANYITNHFPFRITKNSKYVTGIENFREF